MTRELLPSNIELAYPVYLDVPMMTSFAAAIEDGIAYESAVVQRSTEQQNTGKEVQVRAGVPYMSILSSLFSMDLQGRIHGAKEAGSEEEIQIARRHTEASLFMRLRQTLAEQGLIQTIESENGVEQTLDAVEHGALLEVSGQMYRSPLSETLEAVFRVLNMIGIDLAEESSSSKKQQQASNSQQRRNRQGKNRAAQSQRTDEESSAFELDNNSLLGLRIAQRIKDDLEQAKVIDSIMYPSGVEGLSVVVSLSTDALSEGTLDNLLSGRFTVLGKVTRVVEGAEEISLYQRSALRYLVEGRNDLEAALATLGNNAGFALSNNPSSITAPALQLMPLAIYC